jgi:hypothetical protein
MHSTFGRAPGRRPVMCCPDAWLLREGSPVGKSKPGALRLMGQAGVQSYGFTSKGSGVARSNDLAYTYGLVLATYRQAGPVSTSGPGSTRQRIGSSWVNFWTTSSSGRETWSGRTPTFTPSAAISPGSGAPPSGRASRW